MEFLIRLFKSVSYENRLRILERLIQKGEVSLVPLANELKLPYKTVDRNTKILERTGLVTHRTWSGIVYYSLADSPSLKYNHAIFDLIKMRLKAENNRVNFSLSRESEK